MARRSGAGRHVRAHTLQRRRGPPPRVIAPRDANVEDGRMTRLALLLFAFAAGCSDGNPLPGAPADLGPSHDLAGDLVTPPDLAPPPRDPTDHPPLPLLAKHGGPVLKAA